MLRHALAAVFAFGLAMPVSAAVNETASRVKPLPAACDRACLEGVAARYLAALAAHDPGQLPWAEDARTSENNVELEAGDGLWGTIDGPIQKPMFFADPKGGQVGVLGLAPEGGKLQYYSMRLKVEHGRISEVETILHRLDYGRPQGDPTKFEHDPVIGAALKPGQRVPREQMVDIANGYFSTLQLNDGTLFTNFDPNCQRMENGSHNAGYDDAATPVFRLSCGDQFKLGYYRANTRVRDRRFLVVDEERGLVFAGGFIDHAGVNRKFQLTNGEWVERSASRPHSWCMLELFKIIDGKITKIEAVFFEVPYYSKTPWAQVKVTK